MDERLENALKFANYQSTLEDQKNDLQDKFFESRRFYHEGGSFLISLEFLNSLEISKKLSNIVIDENELPIKIDDIESFYDKCSDIWLEAVMEYYTEYERLKTSRSVDSIVNG